MSTTAARATVLSPAPGVPSRPLQPPNGAVRVIQARAVITNMTSTRFSGERHGPRLGTVSSTPRPSFRVSQSQATGSSSTTAGTPTFIHSRKGSSLPSMASR